MRQIIFSLLTLLSFYYRHPMQALFLIVGLVTGVGLWSAVQLINDHARASYAEADQLLGAEAKYWIRASRGYIDLDEYISLRQSGFTNVYPIVETRRVTSSGQVVRIIATDILALGGMETAGEANNPFAAESWLSFIQAPYQSWYAPHLAESLGIDGGRQLELVDGTKLPPAVLQMQEQQGDRIFMDVGAALSVLDLDGFSYLVVSNINSSQLAKLRAQLPENLNLIKNQQALDLSQLTSSLHTNLTALGLLSFVVGIFIVFNAVRFSMLSRHTTIATLRELGVGMGALASAIVLESLIWSLLGAGIGLWIGMWLGEAMLPAVATSLQNLYDANLSRSLETGWHLLPEAFLITLFGMSLALALPLWQAANQVVMSHRQQLLSLSGLLQPTKHMMWISCALIIGACFGFDAVTSVEGGFVIIGMVLLAGAMLLPAIVLLLTNLVARSVPENSLFLRWSVRDALLQLPYLRIALMALLLTLVANIGVTILVGSFREALTNYLDVRLSANIYVSGDVAESLGTPDWLKASHSRYGMETRFADRPANIFAVDPDAPDFSGGRLLLGGDDAFDIWRVSNDLNGVPIIANEQVHFLGGIQEGEVIRLDGRVYRVVGFVHDYGNPQFGFWLPIDAAKEVYPNMRRLGTGLWIDPKELAVAREHLRELGLKPGDWFEQDQIRNVSFQIFDRTFAITAVLNSLTLFVAALALLAALMAVHQNRLVDYGHWRAVGVRWREWAVILGLPLMLMIGCTLVTAIPLGYVLSWLLIHQLNVIAFGWTMPLQWEWRPVLNLSVITFVLVLVTLGIALLRTKANLNTAVRQVGGAQL